MVEISTTADDFSDRNFFEFGIHEVTIEGAVLESLDDGREYIEIGVRGDNGESDTVRLFLSTEKAIKFHLRTLQAICVHNAKSEADKDKVRNAFIGKIDDKKIRTILDKMEGYRAWFQVEQDPARTYTNASGEERPSLDKNIYGYQPRPRQKTREEQVQELMGASDKPVEVNDDEVPFA